MRPTRTLDNQLSVISHGSRREMIVAIGQLGAQAIDN
jgi:hypothetical protein